MRGLAVAAAAAASGLAAAGSGARRAVGAGILDQERVAIARLRDRRHLRRGARGTRLEIQPGHCVAGDGGFLAASTNERDSQADDYQYAEDDQDPPVLIEAIEQ